MSNPIPELLDNFKKGSEFALSKLITIVENRKSGWMEIMKNIYPDTNNAVVMGITGPPGAGKSTLTNAVAGELSKKGHDVGIIAVDPTSPFSGGAVLGDRLRMTATLELEGVFVRSMATRGMLGGLSRAVGDVIKLMDAFGKDVIILETVGVGQDEIEIIHEADLVMVVCVPGMGDSIQAIKAGIMEIADVFVVNKADREGADQVVADLKGMMEMRCSENGSNPQIFKTIAVRDQGISDLAAHAATLGQKKKQIIEFREKKVRAQIKAITHYRIMDWVENIWADNGEFDNAVNRVMNQKSDPYSAVDSILALFNAMSDE